MPHKSQAQEKNAERFITRKLRQIRMERDMVASRDVNMAPNFDRIVKARALKAKPKERPTTAMARLFGETIPPKPKKAVSTLNRQVGSFNSTRRRSPGGNPVGLGVPPRSFDASKSGKMSLRFAESRPDICPKVSKSSGWQDPRKATSTYRMFRGFEYSQEIPKPRLLTLDEKRKKRIGDDLRAAVYAGDRPRTAVTRQLMRDSEAAERIERPTVRHISGYQSQYASVAKLKDDHPYACMKSGGRRVDFKAAAAEEAAKEAAAMDLDVVLVPRLHAQPCSSNLIPGLEFINTIPLAEEQIAAREEKEQLEASEKEYKRLKKVYDDIMQQKQLKAPESGLNVAREAKSHFQMSRGNEGTQYTIGTSKCCAKFQDCDPTRCVHIITDGPDRGAPGGTALKANTTALHHSVTIFYTDTRTGKAAVHSKSHHITHL